MVKGKKFISKIFLKNIQNNENYIFICKTVFAKTGGGGGLVKIVVSSELSLVSGNYHENIVSVVIEWRSPPPRPTKISAIGAMNLETMHVAGKIDELTFQSASIFFSGAMKYS